MWRKTFIASLILFCLLIGSVVHAVSPVGRVREIACAPSNPDVVVALIGTAVWLTRDGGENWIRYNVSGLSPSSENQSMDGSDDESDFESGADIYDVGDESEITDFESRRIEWEPSLATSALAIDTQMETNGLDKIHLAVSDGGTWVVSTGDKMVVGDQAGFRRSMRLPDIRGFVFDHLGRFWVTYDDTLLRLGDVAGYSGETRKWRIQGASVPSCGAREGEILVSAWEGIWTFTSDESALELVRLGKIDATTLAPGSGSLYFATKGRIRLYCGKEYCGDDFPTPPPGIIRIETDEFARVLVRSSTQGWFRLEDGSWLPMGVLALDVDAKNRIWVGTEFGPTLRRSNRVLSQTFRPMDMFDVQFEAQQKLDVSPGPPPKCRVFPINPLPSARLFMGLNQGITRWYESDTGVNASIVPISARRESELYLGLQLIWSLDPVDPSDCYLQRRNWQRQRAQKAAEVETLIRTRQRIINTVPRAGDILETMQLLIEKKRNEELVKVLSKVQLRQEFEQ